MQHRNVFGWGLLTLAVMTVGLKAQIPGVPGVPGIPQSPTIPSTTAIPSSLTPTSNLWSMLCPTDAQLQRCKQKFCASSIGQMFSSMMSPMSLYTGGLFGSCCPSNPFAGAEPGSPGDTANKIAADEAGAKARRAAMRYLGTVDCHYWPEAESSLIVGLRTDKNDCVRWEAAHSIGNGCCCTRKTIAALKIVVEGSEKDGNPSESSIWVKGEALAALQHCICCFRDKPAEVPKEKAGPTAALPAAPLPAFYYSLDGPPRAVFEAEARDVLAKATLALQQPRFPPGMQAVGEVTATAPDSRSAVRQAAQSEPPVAEPPARLQPVAAGLPPVVEAPPRDLYSILKQSWGRGTPRTVAVVPEAASPIQPAQAVAPASPLSVPPPTLPRPGSRDLLTIFKNSRGGQ